MLGYYFIIIWQESLKLSFNLETSINEGIHE
jgi:hypothetical protein